MGRTIRKSIKQSRSKQLYERAFFFKRLAVGAADPTFAAKLQILADEYEGEAARAARSWKRRLSGSSAKRPQTHRSVALVEGFPGSRIGNVIFRQEDPDPIWHPALLDHTTSVHGMASQYVPDDIRDFILKHIATVAQIEALLLIWSNPEEGWGLPQIAARIYTSDAETAKALDGLCADGLLVCRDGDLA